jgi:type I restriction enzyme S subunit
MSKWPVKPLGEVATLQRGFDLPVQSRTGGAFPVFAANGSVGTHKEAKVIGPGVVTGRSGSIGKVHFVVGDYWPLNTALWVKDFHGNDPEWIYYLLQWFRLERFARGGAVPTLNRNLVHSEPVPSPPLDEQRRIVGRIKECLSRVEEIESLRKKNRNEIDGLVPAALEDVFLSVNAREMELPKLFGANPKNGVYLPISHYVQDGGIPMVRMGEMFRRFEVKEVVEKSVRYEKALAAQYGLKVGDVLVARRSIVYEGSGSMAVVTSANQDAIFESSIIRLRLNESVIMPEYFVAFFHSREGFRRRMSITRKATISGVNQKGLLSLSVPVPSIEQQKKSLKRILSIREVFAEAKALASSSEVPRLRESILRKAFAGEL